MKFSKITQEAVMRTSHVPPLWGAYAAVYGAALLWLLMRLRRAPEICALDLRLPRASHCFGSSDLDLLAQTVTLSAPEFFALCNRLSGVLLRSKPWFKLFDLYLFSSSEFELQKRLGAQSFDSKERWIRLLGPKPNAGQRGPEPDNAYLGRALYNYESICQGLFEGEIDIHHARLIYNRVMRIQQEVRFQTHGGGIARAGISDQVPGPKGRQALRGRVCRASFEELAHAHAFALADVSALCATSMGRKLAGCGTEAATISESTPPDTIERAVASCRPAIADLCSSLNGVLQSAILGGVLGSRYEYRIYLIARDELSLAQHVRMCAAVRALFSGAGSYCKVPQDYFRLRHPTILTPTLWRTMSSWYHALRPVEEYYFLKHHGVVLWGEDMRGDLKAPSGADVVRSAAISVADLRNRIWAALRLGQSPRLADLMLGRIPALWLVLAKSVVAASPAEAMRACASSGFPHARILEELDSRVSGRSPGDLPSVNDGTWAPALDSLTDWLDGLGEMALSVGY